MRTVRWMFLDALYLLRIRKTTSGDSMQEWDNRPRRTRRPARRALSLGVVIVVAGLVAGCGGGSDVPAGWSAKEWKECTAVFDAKQCQANKKFSDQMNGAVDKTNQSIEEFNSSN